jgi:hypothetical protein
MSVVIQNRAGFLFISRFLFGFHEISWIIESAAKFRKNEVGIGSENSFFIYSFAGFRYFRD